MNTQKNQTELINYYVINGERKAELYFDKADYKALEDEKTKEIKKYFLFSRSKSCWISKGKYDTYSVQSVLKALDLPLKEKEERLTFEEKMTLKVDRAERRKSYYEYKEDKSIKKAESLQSEFNRLKKDWSWLTQPIIRGHKGSEAFGRSKERVINNYEKGFQEYQKSEYFKSKYEDAIRTAAMEDLKSVRFLGKRIKEAKDSIKKLEWVEKYFDNKDALIEKHGEEKVNEWLERGSEKVMEAYEKLAFYSGCLIELEESGVRIFTKESLQGAEYILSRGSWYKVIRLNNTTVTHSWFCGDGWKCAYTDIQDAVYKGDLIEVYEKAHIKGSYDIKKF